MWRERTNMRKLCELREISNKDEEIISRVFEDDFSNLQHMQLYSTARSYYLSRAIRNRARKLHTVDVCWLLLSSGILVEHSFSIARSRRISLDAAAKSDSSCSSFSRRRFSSRWHVCDWRSISFLDCKALRRNLGAKNCNLFLTYHILPQ